uniref:Uncharacterized protein n=1 Tax=Pristionchus pacificus TaxID=54126 RepID=A0A8R1V062_PRIPA
MHWKTTRKDVSSSMEPRSQPKNRNYNRKGVEGYFNPSRESEKKRGGGAGPFEYPFPPQKNELVWAVIHKGATSQGKGRKEEPILYGGSEDEDNEEGEEKTGLVKERVVCCWDREEKEKITNEKKRKYSLWTKPLEDDDVSFSETEED